MAEPETELDLLEWVANGIRQAYERPGLAQTITPLSDWDLDIARAAIAKVRKHDAVQERTDVPNG